MGKSLIGLGKCSSFYLFIIGNAIFKCLRDCLFNFNSFSPDSDIGLFGFKPVLSNHCIIANVYMYFSYIGFGLLFFFISNKKIMKEKEIITKKNNSISFTRLLIHNKKNKITIKRAFQISLVCLIFVFHSDLIKMLYLFDINGFDFWTFDILFMLLFMKRYFVINIYKHQKYSIIFIIVSCTILLFISTFFPYNGKDGLDSYETILNYMNRNPYFYSILIFLLFMLISLVTSFGRVLSKMLMDIKFISPYILMIITGIIGLFLNLIILLISTKYECNNTGSYKGLVKDFCLVKHDGNIYFDNIFLYISNLTERYQNNNTDATILPKTTFYLELLAMTPIYIIVAFLEFTCEIFTIYYLNPNYILIRDNLYYGTSRIILILYNISNFSEHITLLQFFLLELAEIFALIGYSIYLEIIELRFYGFDQNLKRKIMDRSEIEIRDFLMDSIIDDDSDSDSNDDDDKEGKEKNNNKSIEMKTKN